MSRLSTALADGPNVTLARAGWRRWLLPSFTWIIEARSHRVMLLVLGIWLLNGFDLMLTILAHEQGVLYEENPFASRILDRGRGSIILYKLGLVLLGSYPLIRFRHTRIAEMAAIIIWAVYAAVAMHWSTCYDVYSIMLSGGRELHQAHLQGVTPAP